MNTFGFIRLIADIFGKKLPDLDKIEKRGLLAVKIAQHFALRIDFLDEKVCAHLTKLYRSTGSLPADDVKKLINKYCMPGWLDNFSKFDMVPFASASIGQVHLAKLRNGKEVVIKIIKKDYKSKFLRDIIKLKILFKTIIFFYPKLRKVADPIGILDNIRDYTVSELDLRNEVYGQQKLSEIREKFGSVYDMSSLKFPHFYEELSNQNVLVSERIIGTSFDELLVEGKLSYKTLLDFFNIHGFYMFVPGIFHGDIHPGNILLGKDKKIYLVDTSALSRVGDKIQKSLFNFMEALSCYDFSGAAVLLNKMAEKKISGQKYKKYLKKFIQLYRDFPGKNVSQISLTRKMMETIKIGVHSGMEFEKGLFGIIKSMMYLDGMVLRCNPDAVILEDMQQYITKLKKVLNN